MHKYICVLIENIYNHGWGRHKMRGCIKGHSIRKVEKHWARQRLLLWNYLLVPFFFFFKKKGSLAISSVCRSEVALRSQVGKSALYLLSCDIGSQLSREPTAHCQLLMYLSPSSLSHSFHGTGHEGQGT